MTDASRPDDPAGSMSGEMASRATMLVTSLTTTLTTIMARLDQMAVYGRRNRNIIIGLAISVLLDISLSVITIFLAIGLTHANSNNVTLHQSQLNACTVGNNFRAEQITVWDHLLSLSGKGTPAAQRQIAAFRAYINLVYKPNNCSRLYP